MKTSKLTSDFVHPTPFQVWRMYIYGTPLQSRIGPWRFAKYLHDEKCVELFYYNVNKKENLKCRILNQTEVINAVKRLPSSGLLSPFSWVSQLVRRWKTRQTHTSV